MDISSLKPSERIIEIKHPATGADLGVRVSLISLDDDRMRNIKRQIADQRLRLESRGKHFKSAELEDNYHNTLIAAMVSWEWYGDATLNGEKPALNPKNVKHVFKECPWFLKQVEEAVADEQAFFQT